MDSCLVTPVRAIKGRLGWCVVRIGQMEVISWPAISSCCYPSSQSSGSLTTHTVLYSVCVCVCVCICWSRSRLSISAPITVIRTVCTLYSVTLRQPLWQIPAHHCRHGKSISVQEQIQSLFLVCSESARSLLCLCIAISRGSSYPEL